MPEPVFVPLAAGLQTELADQLVQPGATLVLENCVSNQTGKTEVRFGSDVLSTSTQATIPSGGTLPAVWQLATLDGVLVRFNKDPISLHMWARPENAWVQPTNDGGLESFRKGPIKLDVSPVFSGTAQVSDPTVAVGTNAIVEVFRIDTGFFGSTGIQTTILDRLTRRPIFTQRRTGGARGGRVAISGTRAIVAYEQGGFLSIDAFNLSNGSFVGSVALGAVLAGTPIDIRVGDQTGASGNVSILYREPGGQLRCAVVLSTNIAVNSTYTPRTAAAAAVTPDLAFGWMQDIGGSGKFSIMIADGTNGLRVLWNLPAPAAGVSNAAATHVLDAGATGFPSNATSGIRNIIGTTITSSATGVYRVLYDVSKAYGDPFTSLSVIKIAVWNGAASLGVQYRSVGIRSKFWQAGSNFFFLSAFDGNDQRSYFVLAMSNDTVTTSTTFSAPLAVALPRDAGGLTESVSAPSDVGVDSDGAFYAGVTEQTRTDLIASSGTATGGEARLLGADIVRVRHSIGVETDVGRPAEFIRSLFVPGGLLGKFDGACFDSACLPYYPPDLASIAASQAGGSLTGPANYFYRFHYETEDRNGRVWRSAPSAIVAVATTGVNKQFLVTVATLRLVDRALASGLQGARIVISRSQANAPAAFFQVAVLPNDPTNDSVSFTDNVDDTSLGEELYTDGGGLENQLLPPISNCVEFQGRLVCSESGTGTLWYSLEADFDHGLIFNEALTVDVGDPEDPITALAVFGEQLVAFKSGKIYVVSGQGANALGQGGNYTWRQVDPGVGCSNPQSVVVADDGVWFRSSSTRAGIHRTAGGAAEYVGTGVHAYDAQTFTGAVVIRDKTEIRFYTSQGTTLIWNWTTRAWGTNTGQQCLSAISGYAGSSGVVYASAVDNSVLAESSTVFKEGAATFVARIRSPWYQSGIGGWQRIKRMQGIGSMDSTRKHKTRVALYKNMDDSTPFQTHDFQFDGTEKTWNWELRPAQQKTTAEMIEVTILPYQPPSINVVPNSLDAYSGGGAWLFVNGNFTAGDIGLTVTIAGANPGYSATYTITAVGGSDTVTMTPNPVGAPGLINAATITLTPVPIYTAGPKILGVSLVPMAKEGANKLPASRRVGA